MDIYPLRSLIRPGKLLEQARVQVQGHGGRANVWIFPFYSSRYVFEATGNFTADFAGGRLPHVTNQEAYHRFSSLLEQTMREANIPLFVFIDPRDEARTLEILLNLRPYAPFAVNVPTQPDFAIPSLGKNGEAGAAWQQLAKVMKNLGVSQLMVLGELGFTFRTRKGGCVYAAADNLAKTVDISVEVIKELTFPNCNLAAEKVTLPPRRATATLTI